MIKYNVYFSFLYYASITIMISYFFFNTKLFKYYILSATMKHQHKNKIDIVKISIE